MRMIAIALMGALAAGLGGCATTGAGGVKELSQEQAARMLVVGKTTKAEVRAALGEAEVTPFASGAEVWIYTYEPGTPKFVSFVPVVGLLASNGRTIKELKIIFGADGVVKKYRLHDIVLQRGA